jgi:hypothetical protein
VLVHHNLFFSEKGADSPTLVLAGFDTVSGFRLADILDTAWFLYTGGGSAPSFVLDLPQARGVSFLEKDEVSSTFLPKGRLAVVMPLNVPVPQSCEFFLDLSTCVSRTFPLPNLFGFDLASEPGLIPWPYALLPDVPWFHRFVKQGSGSYRGGVEAYSAFFRMDPRFRSGCALLVADDFHNALLWSWELFRSMGLSRAADSTAWTSLLSRFSGLLAGSQQAVGSKQ